MRRPASSPEAGLTVALRLWSGRFLAALGLPQSSRPRRVAERVHAHAPRNVAAARGADLQPQAPPGARAPGGGLPLKAVTCLRGRCWRGSVQAAAAGREDASVALATGQALAGTQRPLEGAHRQWGVGGDRPGQIAGAGFFQRIQRHDEFDEPDPLRLDRVDPSRWNISSRARPAPTSFGSRVTPPAPGINPTETSGKPKMALFGRDPDIAGQRDFCAAAERIAVHGRDHRRWKCRRAPTQSAAIPAR